MESDQSLSAIPEGSIRTGVRSMVFCFAICVFLNGHVFAQEESATDDLNSVIANYAKVKLGSALSKLARKDQVFFDSEKLSGKLVSSDLLLLPYIDNLTGVSLTAELSSPECILFLAKIKNLESLFLECDQFSLESGQALARLDGLSYLDLRFQNDATENFRGLTYFYSHFKSTSRLDLFANGGASNPEYIRSISQNTNLPVLALYLDRKLEVEFLKAILEIEKIEMLAIEGLSETTPNPDRELQELRKRFYILQESDGLFFGRE